MKNLIIGIIVLLAFSMAVARAGWQGADWDQSAEQVRKTSKLVTRVPTKIEESGSLNLDGQHADLLFYYNLRGSIFKGAMYFEHAGLTQISLLSEQAGSCSLALTELTSSYGRGDGTDNKATFYDRTGHNRITVSQVRGMDYCAINYYPFFENHGGL